MKLMYSNPFHCGYLEFYFWKLVKNIEIALSLNRKNSLCCTISTTCNATNWSMPWYCGNSASKTIYKSLNGVIWSIVFRGKLFIRCICIFWVRFLIKWTAGVDNWYDGSDNSYKESMLLEIQTSLLCYSSSAGEGYSIWWISLGHTVICLMAIEWFVNCYM